MDTEVLETRLQKLDVYVRHLRQLQQVSLDEYLADYAHFQGIEVVSWHE